MDEKTIKFVAKAKLKHGDKYDYSNTVYIKAITKVEIRCPEHGIFFQRASNHLNGQGCKSCGYNLVASKSSMTQEEFIQKAVSIHGDRYGYDDVNYKNNKTKIKINCKEHGIFYQTPINHLNNHGCPKCANELTSFKNTLTQEEFITRAVNVHGNKYDYSDTIYIGFDLKVEIKCNKHGIFLQTPHSHLGGNGCPHCSLRSINNGFTNDGFIEFANGKECTFYIIRCFNEVEEFYKIGITTKTVKERFYCHDYMPYNYTIIKEIKGGADYVWNIENNLKENLKSFYTPCIPFGGSVSECFSDLKEIENNFN